MIDGYRLEDAGGIDLWFQQATCGTYLRYGRWRKGAWQKNSKFSRSIELFLWSISLVLISPRSDEVEKELWELIKFCCYVDTFFDLSRLADFYAVGEWFCIFNLSMAYCLYVLRRWTLVAQEGDTGLIFRKNLCEEDENAKLSSIDFPAKGDIPLYRSL